MACLGRRQRHRPGSDLLRPAQAEAAARLRSPVEGEGVLLSQDLEFRLRHRAKPQRPGRIGRAGAVPGPGTRNLGDRRDAFEKLRDTAADAYRAETGEVWRPRHGSHTSRSGRLTSAAIDARDFQRARENAKSKAHLPEGALIAVAGGKETRDTKAVWTVLDKVKAKHPDMVLIHGGGPGGELFAAKWAESRGVHQVVCKPDWSRHGRAAPFRRNDKLLALMPKGLIAFPGNGITGNLADKARTLGIPVHQPV